MLSLLGPRPVYLRVMWSVLANSKRQISHERQQVLETWLDPKNTLHTRLKVPGPGLGPFQIYMLKTVRVPYATEAGAVL